MVDHALVMLNSKLTQRIIQLFEDEKQNQIVSMYNTCRISIELVKTTIEIDVYLIGLFCKTFDHSNLKYSWSEFSRKCSWHLFYEKNI